MTTVKRIKIEGRATLQKVDEEFGKINVIYGRNGVGKTLLSDIFRAAENSGPVEPGDATLVLEGGRSVNSSDFENGDLAERIRVFSRDFVDENVFPNTPETLVLGRENIANLREIADLESEISDEENRIADYDRKKEEIASRLDELKSGLGTSIRHTLRPAANLEGAHPRLRNFNKSDVDRVLDLVGDDPARFKRDEDTLATIAAAISQHSYPSLPEPSLKEPDYEEWVTDLEGIGAETPRVVELSDKIQDPKQMEWLRDGLRLIGNSSDCVFCLQEVPDPRIKELKEYFNDTLSDFTARIDALSNKISDWRKQSDISDLPESDRLRTDLRSEYQLAIEEFTDSHEVILSFADRLEEILKSKRAHPTKPLDVGISPPQRVEEPLGRIRRLIRRHNDSKEVIAKCEEYERARVAEVAEEVGVDQQRIEELTAKASKAQAGIEEKRDALEKIRRGSGANALSAAQLTEQASRFLGHREISFQSEEDDGTFRVERAGDPAKGLSEGERNALGLIYYLAQLDDLRFDRSTGIAVLDDPVSSFDDLNLYNAVAQIISRTAAKAERPAPALGQVFILTHHTGLLERMWRAAGRGSKKRYRFFELILSDSNSRRTTQLHQVEEPTFIPYLRAFDDTMSIIGGAKDIANPWNSLRICAEGYLAQMLPYSMDQISIDSGFRRVLCSRLDDSGVAALINSVSNTLNDLNHFSAIRGPVVESLQWDHVKQTAGDLIELMKLGSRVHYDDLIKGRERRLGPG